MMTVTAHMVQTPQGLKIVLQDTQGIRMGHPQLDTVLYQVKQRQALARQQGRAPLTKITIQLVRDGGEKTEVTASQSGEPAPNPQQRTQRAQEAAPEGEERREGLNKVMPTPRGSAGPDRQVLDQSPLKEQ